MEGHVMQINRIPATGSLGRAVSGALALTLATAGVLSGVGTAAAAQHGAASRPGGRLAAAGTISTVAGGLGGPGKGTKVAIGACGVGYGDGEVYVAGGTTVGGTVVRKLDPVGGQVATEAGTGVGGLGGNGVPAIDAGLGDSACTTAVDPHGNLVILGLSGGTIMVVAATTGTFYQQHMTAGDLYTVGPGFGLSLNGGLGVDAAGNLLVTLNNLVEVVAENTGTYYGQQMTAGQVYLVAGTGRRGDSGDGGPATEARLDLPGAITADGAGNLVFSDDVDGRVRVVAGKTGTFYGKKMTAGDIYTVAGGGTSQADGIPATKAQVGVADVAVDGAGNLVLVSGAKVRVVAGKTGTFYGQKMTTGDIYTVAGNGTAGFSGDGGRATAAELKPQGVRVDGTGNLVIADSGNSRVRVVAVKSGTFYGKKMTAADIYTVAGNGTESSGNGGPALKAELDPGSVAVDGAGNMLISDTNDNQIRVVAASAGTFYGKKMTADDIYTVAGNGTPGFSGDGGRAGAAELNLPEDVVADGAGNLVIADSENSVVRVVAAKSGTFYGKMMTAGDIYTVAGNGGFGFSGDGGRATKAELRVPAGVAVDGAGNLLIVDGGNSRIRVVAATSGTFYGVAMTAGDIYTVAGDGTGAFSGDGGPATAAGIAPAGVAVDGAGNLVIADHGNFRIRVVAATSGTFYGQAMIANDIYTVAGDGNGNYFGDGGPATAAGMIPESAAVDSAGNLVIADRSDDRLRVVAPATGTFYGVAMTAGDIYTVAGNGGACGLPGEGDGGPATATGLCGPGSVTPDSAGNLLINDGLRIREVTG
jgi:hypothetical protein